MKAFLIAIFIAVSAAASCKTTGCKSGNCCSYWGYCGTGTAYCGSGKYQCACDCNGSNPCVSSCTNYKTTTSLNIRKGPGTSNSIVKTVAAGTTLCVVSTSNGWAKLSDGNYCSANYIKKDNNSTPQTPTSPSCTNYKTTTGLNIRKGPSTSNSIVKSVAAGTTLCVVSISSGWAKLSDGNYCSASYIQKDDGSTPQVPVSSGDKRKCPTFWNKYSKTAYPTRAQYAQGLRSIVGQYVNYTQGSSRWYGINNKVCPPSAPKWADCSSFTTWAFWTAFGGLSDIVNKQNWSAGYTGTMETCGKKISSSSTNCQPGDVILYPGHVATYVGNNQVVNYGSTGPVNVQRYNYHSNGVKGCYRYNLPFGSKF